MRPIVSQTSCSTTTCSDKKQNEKSLEAALGKAVVALAQKEVTTTTSCPVPDKKQSGWKQYLGMIFTLLASLSFSFGVLFAKLLQDYGYNGNCSSFWRNIGITVPGIPLLLVTEYGRKRKRKCIENPEVGEKIITSQMAKKHESVFSEVWPLNKGDNWKTAIGVFFRGFFAASAVLFRYQALGYLPIGDMLVIAYSTPVLVTIFAHFVLGEKADAMSYVIVVFTLIGVTIVAKPPFLTGKESFTTEAIIGLTFAVGALFFGSAQIIITRVVRSVHFAFLTLTVGLIGLLISGSITLYSNDFVYPSTDWTEGLYVAGLTATSYLGQMAIILALQFELAAPVALFRSFDIIVGFILQYLFLDVVPEWTSLIGGCIVIAGVVATGARKYIQK